jgi:hypothetical protein
VNASLKNLKITTVESESWVAWRRVLIKKGTKKD